MLLRDGPHDAPVTLVLAHGAGAPMDSAFMNDMAARLAARGIEVVRFDFPYMLKRRTGGGGPPDRMPVLEASMRAIVNQLGDTSRLALGGKSMGSRVATQLADALGVRAALAFGYPFHPPQKPAQLRTAHLQTIATPTLILQGTRDPFGVPDEVAGYALSPAVQVHWLEDGDHDLSPRKKSGRSDAQNLDEAADQAAGFLLSRVGWPKAGDPATMANR
jgi:predicted alpha/beta-hydrolase family hydrolase